MASLAGLWAPPFLRLLGFSSRTAHPFLCVCWAPSLFHPSCFCPLQRPLVVSPVSPHCLSGRALSQGRARPVVVCNRVWAAPYLRTWAVLHTDFFYRSAEMLFELRGSTLTVSLTACSLKRGRNPPLLPESCQISESSRSPGLILGCCCNASVFSQNCVRQTVRKVLLSGRALLLHCLHRSQSPCLAVLWPRMCCFLGDIVVKVYGSISPGV